MAESGHVRAKKRMSDKSAARTGRIDLRHSSTMIALFDESNTVTLTEIKAQKISSRDAFLLLFGAGRLRR
jgi:hypothetical protein